MTTVLPEHLLRTLTVNLTKIRAVPILQYIIYVSGFDFYSYDTLTKDIVWCLMVNQILEEVMYLSKTTAHIY